MKLTHFLSPVIVAAAWSVVLIAPIRADQPETASIKFSNPAQPGTIKVAVSHGDLRIRGADAAEVTVRTELKPEGRAQRSDGLRVLTSSASYSLTEKDNVITLSYGAGSWPGAGGDFDITVPANTSVIISSAFGGDVSIAKVSGDLEVKSLNGEVKLTDVSGGALVETMNGEIRADIVALKEGKPLSFTSMNGEVALHLPADAKASVRLRTHNGSILTDFDEQQLVTKTASLKGEVRQGAHAMGEGDSDDVRSTVREAVKMGMDAAREAARGAREAMREASRSTRHNNDNENDNDESADVVMPTPPMPPLPPMTGGKVVTGTINGGGLEIRVTTMNGDVTLRKIEAGK